MTINSKNMLRGFTMFSLLRSGLHRRSLHERGFTLIEILIVIAVIGVLSATALTLLNPLEQFAKARDSERKKTLRELAKGLERYLIKKGQYPLTSTWCGEPGSNWTSCGADWIPGLLASKEINRLPQNPKGGTICTPADRSYLYASDATGTCYKLLSHCAQEAAEAFSPTDPFFDPIRPTWSWMVCSPPGSGCCSF